MLIAVVIALEMGVGVNHRGGSCGSGGGGSRQ